MVSLISAFILIALSSKPAFASQDLGCFTQVQNIGHDMKILGFDCTYVGMGPGHKATFYNEKLETLYIFEDGLNNVPLEIPWTQATDLRWKDEVKSFTTYKSEGP